MKCSPLLVVNLTANNFPSVLERSGSEEGNWENRRGKCDQLRTADQCLFLHWFTYYNGTLYTLKPTYFIELLQPAVSYPTRGSTVAEAPRVSGTLHWRLIK